MFEISEKGISQIMDTRLNPIAEANPPHRRHKIVRIIILEILLSRMIKSGERLIGNFEKNLVWQK
jgi:hypothetical protein